MTRFSALHAPDGVLYIGTAGEAVSAIRAGYKRPDDTVYTGILQGSVRNCVDTLVLGPLNEVLMGLRVNKPWKDRWHPSGGGQVPGDSYQETSAAHLKRDLGLVIEPDRFEYVNSASFPWSDSAQGVPCHMNGVLMVVQLTAEELAGRSVPEKGDFKESRFFSLVEVAIVNGFHPAIVLGARLIERNLARDGRLGSIDPELLAALN